MIMKIIIAGLIVSASCLSLATYAQTTPETITPDSVKYGPKLLLQDIQKPKIAYPEPLFFINNKVIPFDSVKNLTAERITSILVYKGAEATARYGSRAKDGAVVISLKENTTAIKEK